MLLVTKIFLTFPSIVCVCVCVCLTTHSTCDHRMCVCCSSRVSPWQRSRWPASWSSVWKLRSILSVARLSSHVQQGSLA